MTRQQETQFEQDRLGNERKKLDTLRAREGFVGVDDEEGIVHITSGDTSSTPTDTANLQILYSLPTHADRVILEELHGYNNDSVDATYSLYELSLDGNGNITGQTRRGVPIEVVSQSTRINSIHGKPFTSAVGVSSEFEGFVACGLIVDHEQYNEPQIEQTQ